MSSPPVVISATATAGEAQLIALHHGVHHLLVVSERALEGVVCGCDLRRARENQPVGSVVARAAVFVDEGDTARHAATFMTGYRCACLAVRDRQRRLTGVVTRGDLQAIGVLPARRGVDCCTTCGSSHGLREDLGGVLFCTSCLEHATHTSQTDELYFTLGGGD